MDVICYSHLRWNFVYQRPQHIMTRLAEHFRVYYFEEPIFDAEKPYLDQSLSSDKVWVVTPHLSAVCQDGEKDRILANLLDDLFSSSDIRSHIAWYYTPMALSFTEGFRPDLIVYDCMDELSAFKFAPPQMKLNEELLMKKADLVFTGGHSLYQAKKNQHHSIYPFPSSIDKEHFGKARTNLADPDDQARIPHPRIGFFGVIDERMDIELLRQLAEARPDWHFVIVGPVVKIDPATLPMLSNIHYLGGKDYQELPSYLAHWDAAMMPFALNESTKFISPTKTPEYLCGGKPVVSTAIQDVIQPYGEKGLVVIADNVEEFVEGLEKELNMTDKEHWQKAVDGFLAENSWDTTVEKMMFLINTKLETTQKHKKNAKQDEYV